MRLVTIYLPQLVVEDAVPLARFLLYLRERIATPQDSLAVAPFVIISRAREKLERAHGAEVDIITHVGAAQASIQVLELFGRDHQWGPWLRVLYTELVAAVQERLQREGKQEEIHAEQSFEAVARRARTVREQYDLHVETPGADAGR